MTEIGAYALSGCTGLSSLTIPSNVVRVGESAFSNCRIAALSMPAQLEYGPDAFYGCTGLNEIRITGIGEMHDYSTSQTGTNSVYGAPWYSSGANQIGDAVTSVGAYAFRGQINMSSLPTMNGVTSIGAHMPSRAWRR